MALSAALALPPFAAAVTVEPLQGATAAQAPIGPDHSRFATDDVDEALLAALAGGRSTPLLSLGTTVDIRYLGTGAARSATVQLAGVPLFDTRSGCDFATALADPFCLIDSIGTARRVSQLTPGSAIDLALVAAAQPLGDASVWRPASQTFSSLLSARWLDLGQGQVVLGFEEGDDGSYNDVILLLSGVAAPAPAPTPVPEPDPTALLPLGLLLLAARRGRHR